MFHQINVETLSTDYTDYAEFFSEGQGLRPKSRWVQVDNLCRFMSDML